MHREPVDVYLQRWTDSVSRREQILRECFDFVRQNAEISQQIMERTTDEHLKTFKQQLEETTKLKLQLATV